MIGINSVVEVTYSYLKDGILKIKRESATPDRLTTIAQCLGIVGAKEPNVYIFKNYNYEQRLNRLTAVNNKDVVEIFDRAIIENQRPDLFTSSRIKAYCLKINKLITTFEAAINNTTDKDKIAKYEEYLVYLKSLCTLDKLTLLPNDINFDVVESSEVSYVIPETPIDILSKSYIP